MNRSIEEMLTEKSWIKIIPKFYILTDEQFASLWNLMPQEPSYISIFGKRIRVPRMQSLFGETIYHFSGETVHPRKLKHPILVDILGKISDMEPKYKYNGVFANWYRDGNDYIGYHSDNEKDLNLVAPIYSISFGEKRNFRIKNIRTSEVKDYVLDNGTLVIMGGNMQKEFKHSVPKSKVNNGKRINLTFRSFV